MTNKASKIKTQIIDDIQSEYFPDYEGVYLFLINPFARKKVEVTISLTETAYDRLSSDQSFKNYLENSIFIRLSEYWKDIKYTYICKKFSKETLDYEFKKIADEYRSYIESCGVNFDHKIIEVNENANETSVIIEFNVMKSDYDRLISNEVKFAFFEKLHSIYPGRIKLKLNIYDYLTLPLEFETTIIADVKDFSEEIKQKKNYDIISSITRLAPSGFLTKISNIQNGTFVEVTVAGEVMNYQKKVSKNGLTTFFTFEIRNGKDMISAVVFPKEKEMTKFDTVQDGHKIVVTGKVDKSNFLNRNQITVYKMAFAGFVSDSSDEIKMFTEEEKTQYLIDILNSDYKYVRPQKYDDDGFNCDLAYEIENEEAQEFWKDKTFIVFDTETTGLNRTKDEIVEIAACKIRDGKIVETFETFIKPSIEMPKEASNISGITNEMLKNEKSFKELAPDIIRFFHDEYLVGHNIEFDISMLKKALLDVPYTLQAKSFLCTCRAARHNINNSSFTLGAVAKYFHLDFEEDKKHRALYDTILTSRVFKVMRDKLKLAKEQFQIIC